MLIPDALGIKFLLVGGVEDLLEDILEATIVLLKDGVLGAHVQREALGDSELETGVGEATDRLVGVVLSLGNTAALEVVDLDGLGLTALGGVDKLKLAGTGDHTVGGTVLVTEGVTADDDRLGPAGNETGDARNDDGLTEDGTTAKKVLISTSRQQLNIRGEGGGAYRMLRIVPLGESHTREDMLASFPTLLAFNAYSSSA